MSRLRVPFVLVAGALMVGALSASAFAQANPSAAENARFANNPCRDPWVSLAVSNAKVGAMAAGHGDSDECSPALYNGGHWNSFAELQRAVYATINAFAQQNLRIELQRGVPTLVVIDMNRPVAGLPANRVVAAGGGNVIAAGAGNIIAAGGGNIIAAGGGNFHTLSADERCAVRLPSGQMVIIKR